MAAPLWDTWAASPISDDPSEEDWSDSEWVHVNVGDGDVRFRGLASEAEPCKCSEHARFVNCSSVAQWSAVRHSAAQGLLRLVCKQAKTQEPVATVAAGSSPLGAAASSAGAAASDAGAASSAAGTAPAAGEQARGRPNQSSAGARKRRRIRRQSLQEPKQFVQPSSQCWNQCQRDML